MTPALVLDGIVVQFGQSKAVDGISLTVGRGEIVGLLGPNGSGKSTTLSVAAGAIAPSAGTTTIDGIVRSEQPTKYAHRVGLVPQEPALYDELSASANLRFFGQLYGLSGCDLRYRSERILERVRLFDRRADRVSTFSGGMKQRLNLAVALLNDPLVLLLDEPTAALDPASRESLFQALHELRDLGHAILLTTHVLDDAENGCDRIAVLEKGKLVAEGTSSDLLRCVPTGRAILYAHLREALPRFFLKSLRHRVGSSADVEVTGRRLRLAAETQESLGRALSIVLSDGIVLDAFRTPPGRLENLLRNPTIPSEQVAPCDAA